MKKQLLSLLCLLAFALPGLADTWTYDVSDDYDSPAWLNLIKSSTGTGDVKATSFDSTDSDLQTISWKYEQTGDATTINRDGSVPKGIVMGSGTKQFSTVTFSTDAFQTKSIAKVTIKIASTSKKCSYSVSLNCGNSSETKDKVLYQNNSGSANTLGTAEFTPNCIGENLSFTINQTGTTTNTKGGFKFCSVTIEFTENTTPSLPTTCTPPIFNIAPNSQVPVGTVVRATCDTPNSTVTISGPGVATPVVGEEKAGYAEFTLTEHKPGTEVILTATATVEGENGPITSDPTNIQFSVVEAPKTISEVLTYDVFKDSKGTTPSKDTYIDCSHISELTGITYNAYIAADYSSIQMRSKNSNSGIVVSDNPNGLLLRKVTIEWNSNTANERVLNIYVDNSKYESISKIYGTTPQGTKAGTIAIDESTTLDIAGDYTFAGMRSSSGAMYINKITLEWEKPEAPETTDVTLDWGEMAKEFTVGETGVTGELSVEPAEALPFVKVSSSNAEVATAEFDAKTGLVTLNFLKASAEPVVITATVDDPDGKFVAKEDATFSFIVEDAEVVLEPEAIVVTPALDEKGNITVTEGTKITFSSKNAAKLSVSIYGAEPTLEANPFIFTATEETVIEVIPVDSEGKPYEAMKLKAHIFTEEAVEPQRATTTYTFEFTKNDHVHPVYGESNNDEYVYLASDGAGIFEPYFCTETGTDTTHSYVDGEGWKLSSDDSFISSYFYLYFAQDLEHNYKITAVKFNYTADDIVEIYEETHPGESNKLAENFWTGSEDGLQFNIVSIYDLILNSIDVTFEHDVVPAPTAAWRDEHHFTLSHEKGYDIYFKIEDVANNTQLRAINRDEVYEGHNKYNDNDELSLYSGQRVSLYAQHPHGMVSKLLSATYDEIVTGIGSIAADSETEVVYFNMQGVRVAEPTEGVYIRVANGKATKVVK